MKNKENISRRDALKRMSKAALAVAVVSMFPSVNTQARDIFSYSDSTDKYTNYDNYKNYGNYNDYKNYQNYTNYDNYKNYNDYFNCH